MFESLVTRSKIRSLIRRWIEYRASVLHIVEAEKAPPAEEQALYQLQAGIAADLQSVTGRLGSDVRPEFQEISALLKQHYSLGSGEARPPFQRDEFERAWHSAFIFLGQLQGMGAAKAAPRQAGRPAFVPTGMERRWGPHAIGLRRWLRFAIQLAVLVLLVYVVGTALGVKMAPDGRFSIENPGSVGKVMQNGLEAFNGLWVGVFGTVAAAYGVVPTVLLLGLLVSIVGYWAFSRG
ncbi:MAG: hypothetical protein HZB25_05935 [Candidatus Eisenbacteria bacterium]|nr:hypothetical protein [Candidatus Eisenbacteria bacterium]